MASTLSKEFGSDSEPQNDSHQHKDGSVVTTLAEPEEQRESLSLFGALFSRKRKVGPDSIATVRSVFDDPQLAQFYQPCADYENLHRFDPDERWTHREEVSVRRKTDWNVLLWILIMFFGLNLDRGNLGSAAADNLLDDLKITTNDYNNAQNMYRVGFLIAEIPSQMLGKRLGPDRWIPFQIILWSLASGGQFFMQGRSGFFACRFFIGLFMVASFQIQYCTFRTSTPKQKCHSVLHCFGSLIPCQVWLPHLSLMVFYTCAVWMVAKVGDGCSSSRHSLVS